MDNKENNTPLSGERVPQVKSVDLYVDDNHIPSIVQTKSDVDLLKETAQDKRNLMRENNKLNAWISELESENAKLREALEPLAGAVRHLDTTSMLRTTVVSRLVKLVVAAEQVLKGKEV